MPKLHTGNLRWPQKGFAAIGGVPHVWTSRIALRAFVLKVGWGGGGGTCKLETSTEVAFFQLLLVYEDGSCRQGLYLAGASRSSCAW